MKFIVCIISGYLFGCFQTGYFVGKLYNVDIRNYGSGNSGTTNALRTLGKKAGLLTLLGDVLKALVAVLIFRYIIFKGEDISKLLGLYTGLGVVLGHNFPFWLKFKGGKGIATTGGTMIGFDISLVPSALLIFVGTIALSKYVSLGSLLVSLYFPIWVYIKHPNDIHMLIVSIMFTILAFIKHKANIIRLINGTENKINKKVNIEKK